MWSASQPLTSLLKLKFLMSHLRRLQATMRSVDACSGGKIVTETQSLVSWVSVRSSWRRTKEVSKDRTPRSGAFTCGQETRSGKSHHWQSRPRRAAARRQPVNGTFELTERCNLACRMCYGNQAPSDAARRAKELSVPAWLELARDAVDNGMVFLLLTGGEIFLRPDFLDLYTPLTRMGLVVNLFTNGTLISDRVAARRAEAPPSRTEITLYGATAATYEAVTGVPDSYTRCCAGIEALVKHRVPLSLKTTITRHNVDELDAMRGGWRTTGACHFRLAGCSPNGATERCRRFPIAA